MKGASPWSPVALAVMLCSVLIGAPTLAQAGADTLFVSPDGNDAWSGRLPEATANGTDGPLATLVAARNAVRELPKDRTVTVILRGGTYALTETLVFSPEDSGSEGHPVVYCAFPGERPTVTGGRSIEGWRQEGQLWVADVPQPPGGWYFAQLFVNGELQTRSREPDTDDWTQWPLTTKGIPHDELHLPERAVDLHYPNDLIRNWDNLHDIEINLLPCWRWMNCVIPLASVDEAEGHAVLAAPAHYNINANDPFRVENTLEGIDEPGEWCLNTKEGKVYYLAPEGVDMTTAEVIAPVLTQLIRVQGDEQAEQFVHDICLRGLTFNGVNRPQWDQVPEPERRTLDTNDSAILLEGAANCAIEECRFVGVAANAVRLNLTAMDNRIVGNEVVGAGGGGVQITGYEPGTKDVNQRNIVSRNHVHHSALEYWHSPAIMVVQSGHNTISYNYIHHMSYIGIAVSGTWVENFNLWKDQPGHGFRWEEMPDDDPLSRESVKPYLHSRHNLIAYNVIHDHMQLLLDGGGIYTNAIGLGNRILDNLVYNATGQADLGIYLDLQSDDVTVANNTVFNCTGPSTNGDGVGNTWESNSIYNMGEEPAEVVQTAQIMTAAAAQMAGPSWAADQTP